MKLAGTSETGWVPMDLADVAAAITTVRASTTAAAIRDRPAVPAPRDPEGSAVPSR